MFLESCCNNLKWDLPGSRYCNWDTLNLGGASEGLLLVLKGSYPKVSFWLAFSFSFCPPLQGAQGSACFSFHHVIPVEIIHKVGYAKPAALKMGRKVGDLLIGIVIPLAF